MPSLYKRLARGARGERGAVLVLSALMMTVMVGFMGLGLDVGTLYYQRRVMQTGADAGALGGERWTPKFGQVAKVGSRPQRRSLECPERDGATRLS